MLLISVVVGYGQALFKPQLFSRVIAFVKITLENALRREIIVTYHMEILQPAY